ncbi:hypothetical protein Ddye_023503 [Dipteronia dyeriana]|uniref:Uncharacterized protein n=1 Tax=Dipteronia dyeriana TaxID=168575 RepID=A0AAD9TU14_9ROSI|nr:hypothetical protein Ddye_023503 [Dipteronia dyeriana]
MPPPSFPISHHHCRLGTSGVANSNATIITFILISSELVICYKVLTSLFFGYNLIFMNLLFGLKLKSTTSEWLRMCCVVGFIAENFGSVFIYFLSILTEMDDAV